MPKLFHVHDTHTQRVSAHLGRKCWTTKLITIKSGYPWTLISCRYFFVMSKTRQLGMSSTRWSDTKRLCKPRGTSVARFPHVSTSGSGIEESTREDKTRQLTQVGQIR